MLPQRKIARLREYDYRQNGAYAITICVFQRRCAFGRIHNGEVHLNAFGCIAHDRWLAIPQHHPQVTIDEFIIMPNHIHGILWIQNEAPVSSEEESELRRFGKPNSGSLSAIIGSYKSGVSRRIGELRGQRTTVWQASFHDHVIRNDGDLFHQRDYIQNNPSKWLEDEFYFSPQK